MDIVEFLLARISETEAAVVAEREEWRSHHLGAGVALMPAGSVPYWTTLTVRESDGARWVALAVLPEHVMAECDAKRAVLQSLAKLEAGDDDEWITGADDPYIAGVMAAFGYVATRMAEAYADHPDFREEWRP